MKGDFTRDSFQPQKHFSSVRSQQGRVCLDAEFNEAQDIANYLDEVTRQDTIGLCGIPKNDGGFGLSLLTTNDGQDIALSPGRIYVDGILAVNEPGRTIKVEGINSMTLKVNSARLEGKDLEPGQWVEIWSEGEEPQSLRISNLDNQDNATLLKVEEQIRNFSKHKEFRLRRLRTLLTQPDYPLFTFPEGLPDQLLPQTDGFYLAYLDVWSRHITALEDPSIQEIALGGPDTATRSKTLAQVKLWKIADKDTPPTCSDFGPDWSPLSPSTARLSSRAQADPRADRPCLVPAQAGYRGQENQLYRVEIHVGGNATKATFKWSRDNGTLLTAWSGPDATDTNTMQVDSLGPDAVRRFRTNQWVEISDETYDLHNHPGKLLKLTNAVGQTLTLDGKVTRSNFPHLPKVRGWDHEGSSEGEGAIRVREDEWILLEDGVEIFFEKEGTYSSGDYWLIPARCKSRDVIWPRDDSGNPLAEPPLGIKHHYCPLGLLQKKDGTWQKDIIDCRRQFLPLTDLINIQSCGEIVVSSSDDLQTIFDRIPHGGSAKLCFHPGIWNLSTTVTINNKGSLILVGAGEATQLVGSNIDRVLQFTNCKNITVENITVKGGNKGEVGNGLQGSLSFKECENITLDKAQITCASYNSRRISAIEVQTAEEITICNSHIQVGHRQIGLLLINGKRITVHNNTIKTIYKTFSLNLLLNDPQVTIALGRHLINEIKVNTSDSRNISRGTRRIIKESDSGSESRDRISVSFPKWGSKSLVFTTDQQINIDDLTELLDNEQVLAVNSDNFSPEMVKNRMQKLRSRLARQLLDPSVTLPSALQNLANDILHKLHLTNSLATGSQGIVIAGKRTPSFGSQEPYVNSLFITSKNPRDLAPNATITNNQITGFAEGIHVGTSDDTNRTFRSYYLQIVNNTIQLHASSLAKERHGIFVGHAHTVKIIDNLIHLIWPKPDKWTQSQKSPKLSSLPPTDGIRLHGVYGPLLQIRQNYCIGVTRGIHVHARHAWQKDGEVQIFPVWSVLEDNAYAGLGSPYELDLPD